MPAERPGGSEANTVTLMRDEYDFKKGKRGAVAKGAGTKTRITIRLDSDIVDWFKARVHEAGGGSYQALINAALREAISSDRETLEETLRRVVREELTRAS